ncbi:MULTISPECIES: hypothetical protein [Roseateles]|nr:MULTISPECIES: hypothetical protein [Roseateles]
MNAEFVPGRRRFLAARAVGGPDHRYSPQRHPRPVPEMNSRRSA